MKMRRLKSISNICFTVLILLLQRTVFPKDYQITKSIQLLENQILYSVAGQHKIQNNADGTSAPGFIGGNHAGSKKVFDKNGNSFSTNDRTDGAAWSKNGKADSQSDACITWDLTSDEAVTSVTGNITGENEIIGAGSSAPFMSAFLPYNNGQRLWVGTTGWIPSSPAGPDPMRYVEFNVSPQSGYTYTVTNISFDYNDNPLGTDFNILNMQAAYSTDNWSTQTVLNQSQLVYLNTSTSHFSQSVNVIVAAGQKFSLRIYPYPVIPGIAGTPTFAIHRNVEICGTASPAEVKTGSICGMKFNDLNGNGEMDINEPGIPDWTIKLSGEDTLTAVTDKTGHYCFTGLNSGTYVLSEEMQTGWRQTYPASPGTHTETLEAGQEINDVNFGNIQIAPADSGACVEWSLLSSTAVTSVTGNLNAQPEIISPGSGPTPMTVYGYNNGQQLWVGNQGGTWVPNDMNNPTLDPTRYIQFDVSPDPGTVFTVTNVSFNYGDFPLNMNFNILSFIAFYSTQNWSSGTQLNSSPLIYLNTSMMLFSQSIPGVVVHSGQTFSLRIYIYPVLHGVATTPTFAIHNNVEICGTTSAEKVNTGSICGMKFNDLNGNGIKDIGEPGIEGWTIKAAGPDTASAVTDATGEYCITDLNPGTYSVSEINQPGWQQTRPESPAYYTIFLAEGQTVVNVDFGNRQSKNDNCIEPPSGMVAWWPLDETAGTNSADLAGYDNAGTQINGPASVAGKVLSGMQFDGVNDFISVQDHPELNFGTGDFSVDAWVKTSANSGIKIIVDKQTLNGFIYQGYSFYLNYGYLTVQLADGIAPNSFTNYNSAVFVADGNWHHVGVTVSRNNHNGIIFYKDGVGTQYGDPTLRPGNLDNSSILTLGRQSFADQNKFSGILDEVELFNRVLSTSEMKSIFDADSSGKCKPETPTSVTPKDEIPKSYELFRAYPNPFNPVTRIGFQIPQRSSVVLKVYDALGKEIRTLVNATKEAGYYNVDFDASDLPSGLYIYQMRTGNFSQSGKVLLVK